MMKLSGIILLIKCMVIADLFLCALGLYSACKTQKDCSPDQCCARRITSKIGFCMSTRQLGDMCTPTYLFGRGLVCGCRKGLTCALVEKNKLLHLEKHRCVMIPEEPKEKDTKNSNNSTDTKNVKFITAKELSTLLRLLKERPKVRWT